MKLRNLKYCLKEGLINTYRNKLMSIASISIIFASLVLFGIYLIVTTNIEYNAKTLASQPEMTVFCDEKLDETQALSVYNLIVNNPEVEKCEIITKQDAFKKAKEMFGNDEELLGDFGYDFLPISFVVKIKNPEKSDEISKTFEAIKGVAEVEYSQRDVYVISTVVTWIKYFSVFLMILFSIFSILIISNTVRIAMYSRRKEINIMKYIGATDWFIRWPFIIEGIIIGIIGSSLGYFFVCYLYEFLIRNVLVKLEGVIKFIDISVIRTEIIMVYLVVGVVIGALGSAVSIRKYLKV